MLNEPGSAAWTSAALKERGLHMLDRHTTAGLPSTRMKRISLFVSERQYEQFLALSNAMGQPYAELIREALNGYLSQHRLTVPIKKVARKRVTTRTRA